MIVIDPQKSRSTAIGAMKSLISDVNEVEERDFTYASANEVHELFGMTFAHVRSIAASPNCAAGRSTAPPPVRFSETVLPLTWPSEQPDRDCGAPQAEPVHFRRFSEGF